MRALRLVRLGTAGGAAAVTCLLLAAGRPLAGQQSQSGQEEGFRFRSGVELINVTATVTDSSGRFMPGLRREDFRVFEDGELQEITHFSNERVPVSLGIALDTSGSMVGEKFTAARDALDRFLFDLLDPADEIFLYGFSNNPDLIQDWTTDRNRLSRALRMVRPNGGTAMYDAVAEAVPMAQSGEHRKKALVVISDGNDTSSRTDVPELKQLIRETEVLVYAIGIDGRAETVTRGGGSVPRVPLPLPFPFPFPTPGRRQPPSWPQSPRGQVTIGDRVNVAALREITDDSGGRTEIIRSPRDLDPATANIADELSRQYYLGYAAKGTKDGRWHAIRVEVTGRPGTVVRARRGYVAT
jgi:Ca-activated chloride channel family protein